MNAQAKPKLAVIFRPVHKDEDVHAIAVEIEGKPAGYVLWVDVPAGRVCRVNALRFAWGASKRQAEDGAAQIQELYDEGAIA